MQPGEIEREDVLRHLLGALRTEDTGYYLITGGPGTGKTVLTQQLVRQVSSANPRKALVHLSLGKEGHGSRDWKTITQSLTARVLDLSGARHGKVRGWPDVLYSLGGNSRKREGPALLLVLDGLDATTCSDGDDVSDYLPSQLPSGVQILCASRRTQALRSLEAAPPRAVVDLDSSQWSQSNQTLVRRYFEQQATLPGARWTKALVKEAVRASQGQIHYAAMLAAYVRSLNPSEKLPRLVGLPSSLSAFFEVVCRELLSTPEPQGSRITLGLGLLCAAREPLERAQLLELDEWGPAACNDFLKRARPLLQEEFVGGTQRFGICHAALKEFLAEGYFAGKLADYHDRFTQVGARITDVFVGRDGVSIDAAPTVWDDFMARHLVFHLVEATHHDAAERLVRDFAFLAWVTKRVGVIGAIEALTMVALARPGESAERLIVARDVLAKRAFHLRQVGAAELDQELATTLFNGLVGKSWAGPEVFGFFRFGKATPVLRLLRPAQAAVGWKYAFAHARRGVVASAPLDDDDAVVALEVDGQVTWLDLKDGTFQRAATVPGAEFRRGAIAASSRRALLITTANEVLRHDEGDVEATRLGRHEANVKACVVSSNGTWGVTADSSGTVRLWDLKTGGTEVWRCRSSAPVLAICETTGTLVIADDACVVVRARDGSSRRLAELDYSASSLAVSCDGRFIVVGDDDGGVSVVPLDNESVARRWRAHRGSVTACAFDRASNMIITGGVDRVVRLWSLDGRRLRGLRGHLFPVVDIKVTRDGRHILSTGANGAILAWEASALGAKADPGPWVDCSVARPLRVEREDVRAGVRAIVAHVASISNDTRLRLWTGTADGFARNTVRRSGFSCCAISPEGTCVAAGTRDGEVFVYNMKGEQLLASSPHVGRVRACDWSPRVAGLFATAGEDRRIVVSLDGITFTLAGHGSEVRAMAFSCGEERRLVSAGSNREVICWDLVDKRIQSRTVLPSPATSCKRLFDGSIALGCEDGSLRRWDGTRLDVLSTQPEPIRAFALAGVGAHAVIAAEEEALVCLRLRDSARVATLPTSARITCVDADEDLIVAGDEIGNLFVIDFVASMTTSVGPVSEQLHAAVHP